MADRTTAKKVKQQCKSVARHDAIDEERLAFERLGDRAGWGVVRDRALVDKLRELFEDRRKTPAIIVGAASRTADQILSIGRPIAEIEPIGWHGAESA